MEKRYDFKNGYQIGGNGGTALMYHLIITVDDENCYGVYRLAEALDREYKLLLAEQFDFEEEKGEWTKWHLDIE